MMDQSEIRSLRTWYKFIIGTLIIGYSTFILHEYVPIHIKQPNLADNVVEFFALITPILVILILVLDFIINRDKRYLVVSIPTGIILFPISVYFNFTIVVDIALDFPYRMVLYEHKTKNQEILLLRHWYDDPFEVIKSYDFGWFTYEIPYDTLALDRDHWEKVNPPR